MPVFLMPKFHASNASSFPNIVLLPNPFTLMSIKYLFYVRNLKKLSFLLFSKTQIITNITPILHIILDIYFLKTYAIYIRICVYKQYSCHRIVVILCSQMFSYSLVVRFVEPLEFTRIFRYIYSQYKYILIYKKYPERPVQFSHVHVNRLFFFLILYNSWNFLKNVSFPRWKTAETLSRNSRRISY